MVSSGANNVLGGCGTKADYRWNQGFARSCLPQVSSQIGPRLAFVSSFPPIDNRLPLQRLVCVCVCLDSGETAVRASFARRFSTPPAKSSSGARRLPCSLHPQILAVYLLSQLSQLVVLSAPEVGHLDVFAWVLQLRLRVAMM